MAQTAVERSDTGDSDAILVVTGEIDVSDAERLADLVDDTMDTDPQRISLDMAGVTFMGSTGIGVIVRANNRCRESGCHLVLRSPSAPVRDVLRIAGLEGLVPIED